MATTPALALSYPTGIDAPSMGSWSQGLALSIESALTKRIQSGGVVVYGTGTDFVSMTITFPQAFSGPPNVVVDTRGWVEYLAAVGDITQTGFQMRVTHRQKINFTAGVFTRWIASDV